MSIEEDVTEIKDSVDGMKVEFTGLLNRTNLLLDAVNVQRGAWEGMDAKAAAAAQSAQEAQQAAATAGAAVRVVEDARDLINNATGVAEQALVEASLARNWATKPDGEVVEGQGYSALRYASMSGDSALAAAQSAVEATGSAGAALTAATAAENWATKSEGEVEPGRGYSALYYAIQAHGYADDAMEWSAVAQGYANESSQFSTTSGEHASAAMGFRDAAEQFAITAQQAAQEATGGQINSDWAETDVNAKSYIHNKPLVYTKSETDAISANYTDLSLASNSTTVINAANFETYRNKHISLGPNSTLDVITADLPQGWKCRVHLLANPSQFRFRIDGVEQFTTRSSLIQIELYKRNSLLTAALVFTPNALLSSREPLANGTATAGTSMRLAREDHVHPETVLDNAKVIAALGYTPWHNGNDGSGSGLDADLLDGAHADEAATAGTIVKRDSSGTVFGQYVFVGVAQTTRSTDTVFFSGTTGSIRPNTKSGFLTSLGLNLVDNTADINKPISTAAQNALNQKADITYVDDMRTSVIAEITSGAPDLLNTLDELATALGDDPNFATTVMQSIAGKENKLAEGTLAQYLRGDKTWQDIGATVRNTVLTGYTAAAAAVVAATDSILQAIAKLQAQVSARLPFSGGTMEGHIDMNGNQIVQARFRGGSSVASATSGTLHTINAVTASKYTFTATGASQFVFGAWPGTGEAMVRVDFINFGNYSITPPSVIWTNPDGTETSSLSAHFAALAAAGGRSGFTQNGRTKALFWTDNGGNTVYGAFL